MSRRFDHIDLRVPSLEAVQEFYETILPSLGFTRNDSNATWLEFEHVDGDKVSDYFAVTECQGHRPNQSRIAFWADSTDEVDRIAGVLKRAGARNIEGPDYESEFYYAVFFEDPAGNRFEVCNRTRN